MPVLCKAEGLTPDFRGTAFASCKAETQASGKRSFPVLQQNRLRTHPFAQTSVSIPQDRPNVIRFLLYSCRKKSQWIWLRQFFASYMVFLLQHLRLPAACLVSGLIRISCCLSLYSVIPALKAVSVVGMGQTASHPDFLTSRSPKKRSKAIQNKPLNGMGLSTEPRSKPQSGTEEARLKREGMGWLPGKAAGVFIPGANLRSGRWGMDGCRAGIRNDHEKFPTDGYERSGKRKRMFCCFQAQPEQRETDACQNSV